MKLNEIHIRDPYFINEGKDYYLIGTTGGDCWNNGSDFSVYKTNNLIDFEFVSTAFDTSKMQSYKEFWAPEIHKYKNKYYLLVSAKKTRRGTYILVSDEIDKGYELLTGQPITPSDWTCLDATLYIEDQKPYLIFSNEWVDPISKDGDGSLFVARLSDDLKEIKGECKKIVSGKNCGFSKKIKYNENIFGYVAEGPFLDKNKDGELLLYWSTITEKGYCVAVSKSKNGISGEFVFDKILFDKDGGHSMVFFKDGKKYITFHQPNNTPNERAIIVDLESI